jgi:translation initiation factor 2D
VAREAVANVDGPTSGVKGKAKELEIQELWKPSGGAIAFWEACGVECVHNYSRFRLTRHRKNDLLPPSELKAKADLYIAQHALTDPANPRMVLLDAELGRAVGVKRPAPGEKMARDEVIKGLKANVAWNVSVGGVIKFVSACLSSNLVWWKNADLRLVGKVSSLPSR